MKRVGFRGGRIVGRRQTADRWEYDVVVKSDRPAVCPHCGAPGHMQGHGMVLNVLADLPIKGKPLELHVRRQRWRCTACGATTTETLADKAKCFRMTTHLRQYVLRHSARRPFSDVARETGLDETTIRRIWESGHPEKD